MSSSRSLNIAAPEADTRPVLVPGGNKAPAAARKPSPKPLRKAAEATPEKPPAAAAAKGEEDGAKKEETAAIAGSDGGARKGGSPPLPSPRWTPPRKPHDAPAVLLNASCSSEANVDSLRGQASGRRTERSWPKRGKAGCKAVEKHADVAEVVALVMPEAVQGKMRCAWVTPTTVLFDCLTDEVFLLSESFVMKKADLSNFCCPFIIRSDPHYVTFHDEEWGVPVHDDRRLFELLVLSGALAELSWPEILKRRQFFRDVFMNFDLIAVSKINEKKLVAPGSIASSLLPEQKLRAVLENARQIVKIADEFGSFSQYCWGFLNHKPIVSKFRYPRQVPVKSPKADMMSKDMVRRGLRGVGPTVIYSFMQAAGLTNDHLVSCYRFKECNAPPTVNTEPDLKTDKPWTKNSSEEMTVNRQVTIS